MLIKLKIKPDTVIRIKGDKVMIDGAVDGSIWTDESTVNLVSMDGEEAVFDGGTITFGATEIQ